MDIQTHKYIDNLTQLIVDKYKVNIPIIDICDVVRSIGGDISEQIVGLDDGIVMRNGNGFQIIRPTLQDEMKKKFFVAHDLGHLFLHMGYMISNNIWEKQSSSECRIFKSVEQEYQANKFALCFLMPQNQFIKELNANKKKDNSVEVAKLADYFNVSFSTAFERMNSLYFLRK